MAEQKKKPAPRKPRDPNAPKPVTVDAVTFVKAWQAATTLDEAKKVLGNAAGSRAQRMRKQGVNLKTFGGGRSKLDVAALNALIGSSSETKDAKPAAGGVAFA